MIYFDNAATSFYKPSGVAYAVYNAITSLSANPGRSSHSLSVRASQKVYECREQAASLFNCEPEQVVFTQNATLALNMAIKGALKDNCHVLCSDCEHNSVLRPIYSLSSRGITHSKFQVDLLNDDITISNIRSLIRPNTKAIICTHASNVLGKILPVKKILQLCKQLNLLFILDASQTAGILSIDMSDGYDIVCCAGHKGLMGPCGTGLMLLGKNVKLNTIIEGGTGVFSNEPENPLYPPERFESGTLSVPNICGLCVSLKYINSMTTQYFYEKENKLAAKAYSMLSELKNISLYTPAVDKSYVGVVSFNVNNTDCEQVCSILDENNIMARGGFHCSYITHQKIKTDEIGTVRISFCEKNTKYELEKLMNILKNI